MLFAYNTVTYANTINYQIELYSAHKHAKMFLRGRTRTTPILPKWALLSHLHQQADTATSVRADRGENTPVMDAHMFAIHATDKGMPQGNAKF